MKALRIFRSARKRKPDPQTEGGALQKIPWRSMLSTTRGPNRRPAIKETGRKKTEDSEYEDYTTRFRSRKQRSAQTKDLTLLFFKSGRVIAERHETILIESLGGERKDRSKESQFMSLRHEK